MTLKDWMPLALFTAGAIASAGALRQFVVNEAAVNVRQDAWIDKHDGWSNDRWTEITARFATDAEVRKSVDQRLARIESKLDRIFTNRTNNGSRSDRTAAGGSGGESADGAALLDVVPGGMR